MSAMQKILKFILPEKLFQKIEEESGKWFIECGECGFSRSYWQAGGVRACGIKKKKIFGRCPNCKKYKFFKVVKH